MEGQGSNNGGGRNNSHPNGSSSINDNDNNINNAAFRDDGGDDGGGVRWTCEACGCHTNESTDRTCSICGTSNAVTSILRRPGSGGPGAPPSFATRAGWFARGLGAASTRRGIMNDELGGLNDEDMWAPVVTGGGADGGGLGDTVSGQGGEIGDADSAIESLIMEVTAEGIGGRGPGGILSASRTRLLDSRQRFMDAARAFSQYREAPQMVDPLQLLRFATENSPSYQPVWAKPSSLLSSFSGRSTRSSSANAASSSASSIATVRGIEVGEGERMNLAHVSAGSSEGLAIRAEAPLPRNDAIASFRMPSNAICLNTHAVTQIPGRIHHPPQRKAYGFRIAFNHPTCETGGNMGGCYLVGITTANFSGYGDPSGLQKSPYFWGVDDSGQKFEGSRYINQNNRGTGGINTRQQHGGSTQLTAFTSHSNEMVPSEVSLNPTGALFGSREVVTVIVDFESRSMTFWRDATLLGTLIRNLPRSGNIYPVAVPFNCGVTVAITGLDNDPLPLLRTFASDWKRLQQERDEHDRKRITEQCRVIIQDGKPTPQCVEALKALFLLYVQHSPNDIGLDLSVEGLKYPIAARLWYRCGLKLSHLDTIFTELGRTYILFEDFLHVIQSVVNDDYLGRLRMPQEVDAHSALFVIGDKVELVEGYEKFGDTAGGPLQFGDRGIVVDLQYSPTGEVRSIRVLHNGRRWWYQPQVLMSERSGLFESPSVWFIRGILRSHGFDHVTLQNLTGKPVCPGSWRFGDIVVPKSDADAPGLDPNNSLVGRIVLEMIGYATLAAPHREFGTVLVESIGSAFSQAVGIKSGLIHSGSSIIESRRISATKLVYSNVFDPSFVCERQLKKKETADKKPAEVGDEESTLTTERNQAEVLGVSRLERSSIDAVAKESKKSLEALATLFSAGLPDAIMAAVCVAERQMNSLEPREDVAENILALGGLLNYVAEQLFTLKKPSSTLLTPTSMEDSCQGSHARTQDIRNINLQNRRQNSSAGARDVLRRDEGNFSLSNHSSMQQRRNLLQTIISRASRRSDASSYLSEFSEGNNNLLDRDNIEGHFSAAFASMREISPFVFGSPSEFTEAWSHGSNALNDVSNSNPVFNEQEVTSAEAEASARRIDTLKNSYTFLDKILRCRSDESTSEISSSLRQRSAAYAIFARRLISSGILVNSVDWTKAIVDEHNKKMQLASTHLTLASLRHVVDEDGTPLLDLAVTLGCSIPLVNLLTEYGCPVGPEVLRIACRTNQPELLTGLLQHTSYIDGTIDFNECSLEVRRVLEEAKARQAELDRRMRETAGKFLIQLVRKLFELCLTSRRNQNVRLDQCSKAICEVLVGNLLLRTLHRAQNSVPRAAAQSDHDSDRETPDRSGRFSVDDNNQDLNTSTQGLLGLLPRTLLGECLLSEMKHLTQYMIVIEDYLYSKDMTDIASGLTFLQVLLHNFPVLKSSTVMQRFGIAELTSYHSALASNRIAELLSKQVATGISDSCRGFEDDNQLLSALKAATESGSSAVRCPKKHITVLHITRHSSFRCDLCGNGVERARPMHGCRECDWDACEDCTDKAECGLAKNAAVKGIASDCIQLLEVSNTLEEVKDESFEYTHVLQGCMHYDTTARLNDLCVRLLQRDFEAAKELGELLKEPGDVSVHQFLTIILPSLHAALVGRSSADIMNSKAGHQSKKPRRGISAINSCEGRLEYCRAVLRLMIMEPGRVATRAELHTGLGSSVLVPRNDDDNLDNETVEDSREMCFAVIGSEVLRRLHQILSLNENVQLVSSAEKRDNGNTKGNELQALTKFIEVQLIPSTICESTLTAPDLNSIIHVEPLLPIDELQWQIIRTYRPVDRFYEDFCKDLARDRAIIIERSRSVTKSTCWQIAQVLGFDPLTGAHSIVRATRWATGQEREHWYLAPERETILSYAYTFCETKTELILAAREYYILERNSLNDNVPDSYSAVRAEDAMIESRKSLQVTGIRVESNCGASGTWDVYTLVGASCRESQPTENDYRFFLVSDEGELHLDVIFSQIRILGNDNIVDGSRMRDDRTNMFPVFATRQKVDSIRDADGFHHSNYAGTALKRSWSAIGLSASMRPIDLNIPVGCTESQSREIVQEMTWEYYLGDNKFRLSTHAMRVEVPPQLAVLFSTQENLPGFDFSEAKGKTLVRAIKEMQTKQGKYHEWPPKSLMQLFFTIRPKAPEFATVVNTAMETSDIGACVFYESKLERNNWYVQQPDSRSRKLSSRSVGIDDEATPVSRLCDGIDELCMQCMEVISLLAEFADNNSVPKDKDDSSMAGFANVSLSKKLTDQLDDPLCVVGGLMPEWCVAAPGFAPRVFSYDARRALLERAAFGVSRSTLKQQEAKVNVGRLRQRMASLRSRAVELVGEAFSGGAEDPTALQLQADELYGMEEALASRVLAAFRSAKWQEHSLQVAKVAVRRDHLLADAASVMERYAIDPRVCRRRLEVRFDGESGFDAASGDEAGVTRGFFADVAEALLSTDNVSGVYCASNCSHHFPLPAPSEKTFAMEIDDIDNESSKLPLWIPDLDNSSQVVIPTPRSDRRSSLGVFPRPIPSYHPKLPEVRLKFRLMGRVFASAMRDGFMFPLPISAAFLKLVQHGKESQSVVHDAENLVLLESNMVLSSAELPRPGFLGGEIYAAEYHICRALDELDALHPPLSHSELQRRYEEIETDKNFGRVALGKSYDLSFKEYFEDRTFVDPLDPTQDEDAVPLCPKGHLKSVTIYNIREWVTLAKSFVLHEGVLAQAVSFRQGVEDFFHSDFLRIFTAEELQRDVCGVGGDVDNWDEGAIRKLFKLDGGKGAAEALVAVAAIGGEGGAALSRRFGPSSPTIAFLVNALIEASPVQRRQFLSFVTSVPIVTPGRIEVVPMVSPNGDFLPMRDPCCLPRANTCSRRLYLPKFETFESFAEVLWAVVREESKFKGFYEWRGN